MIYRKISKPRLRVVEKYSRTDPTKRFKTSHGNDVFINISDNQAMHVDNTAIDVDKPYTQESL